MLLAKILTAIIFVLSNGFFFSSRVREKSPAWYVAGLLILLTTLLGLAELRDRIFRESDPISPFAWFEPKITAPGEVEWQQEVSRVNAHYIDRIYNATFSDGRCKYNRFDPPFQYARVDLDGSEDTVEIVMMWEYEAPCEGHAPGEMCGASLCTTTVHILRDQGLKELLTVYANQIDIGKGRTNGLRDLVVGGTRTLKFDGSQYR